MAKFYGWLKGHRGETTRCGSASSGIWAKVQSWKNNVSVTVREGDEGEDEVSISFGGDKGQEPKIFIDGQEYGRTNYVEGERCVEVLVPVALFKSE